MVALKLVRGLTRQQVEKVMLSYLEHRSVYDIVTVHELRAELCCRKMADNPVICVTNLVHGETRVQVRNTYVGDFDFIAKPKSGKHDGDY